MNTRVFIARGKEEGDASDVRERERGGGGTRKNCGIALSEIIVQSSNVCDVSIATSLSRMSVSRRLRKAVAENCRR